MESTKKLVIAHVANICQILSEVGMTTQQVQVCLFRNVFTSDDGDNKTSLISKDISMSDMLKKIESIPQQQEFETILGRADRFYCSLRQLLSSEKQNAYSTSKNSSSGCEKRYKKNKAKKGRQKAKCHQKKIKKAQCQQNLSTDGNIFAFKASADNIFTKKPLKNQENRYALLDFGVDGEQSSMDERIMQEKQLLRKKIIEIELLSKLAELSNSGLQICLGNGGDFRIL